MNFAVCGLALALVATEARATVWEFVDIEGRGAGTLNACAASVFFRDGFVSVRLYAEEMDVLFRNEKFAMPYDQVLGPVELIIDDKTYLGLGSTFPQRDDDRSRSTSLLQITPRSQDYEALFDAFRIGGRLSVHFPSGDGYDIPLNGSARALNLASDCWRKKSTGPDEKNPFSRPGNNIEEPTTPQLQNPFEKNA